MNLTAAMNILHHIKERAYTRITVKVILMSVVLFAGGSYGLSDDTVLILEHTLTKYRNQPTYNIRNPSLVSLGSCYYYGISANDCGPDSTMWCVLNAPFRHHAVVLMVDISSLYITAALAHSRIGQSCNCWLATDNCILSIYIYVRLVLLCPVYSLQ